MLGVGDWKMWWREETIRPTGDGFYGGIWVKNSDCSAGSAYTMVDETSSDGDTTFCETDGTTGGGNCALATGPGKESFALGNPAAITASDSILKVTVNAARRRVGGTPATFRVGVRENSTDTFGTTNTAPTTYAEETGSFTTRPGGGAWNLTAVNAAEAIIESVSLCGVCDVRVTQVYAVVEYVVMTTADLNLALTGNGLTGNLGALSPARTLFPTGNAATATPGNLAPARSVPIKAVALEGFPDVAGFVGSVSPSRQLLLAGLASSGAVGTVTPSGGDGVVAVFRQPQRISLNRRGPSITVKGR